MKHVVLMAMVMLLCGMAEGQEWVERQPKDSTLHIESLGGNPDEFWILREQKSYATFHCHYGYWSWPFMVETDYCWSDDTSSWDEAGGYTGDEAGTDEFLDWYETTRVAGSRDNAEEGPTIETAIGDIVVHAFDVEKDKSHANFRECMGFYAVWDRGHGGMRDLFAKSLTFYACDKSASTMSEIKLTRLLSGLSIDDEIDALIEE